MLALPLVISEGPLAGIIIAMNITSVLTIDYLIVTIGLCTLLEYYVDAYSS